MLRQSYDGYAVMWEVCVSDLEIIGDLHGAHVLISRETRHVYISHPYFPPIKFSIDHPYIQGSRLERDARAVLDAAFPPAERVTPSPPASDQPFTK